MLSKQVLMAVTRLLADLVVQPALVKRDKANDPRFTDDHTQTVPGRDPRNLDPPGPQSAPRQANPSEGQ